MAKQTYSEETKAAAMAALLTGQSVNSVAREYKIAKGTVSSWKRRVVEAEVASDATQTAREESRDRIGALLIEYLEASITALREQAKVFGNPEWLKKQEASQLAVLHGVQTDKAVRLLEALGGPDHAGDTP